MRKVILSILLAGVAATPAIAQDHGRWRQNQQQSEAQPDGHQAAREARQEARQERQQTQPQQQVERSQRFEMRQQQQAQPQVEARRQWQGGGGFDRRNNVETQVQVEQQQQQAEHNRRSYDGQAQWQQRRQANDQQIQEWQQRRQAVDGQRRWQQSGQTWQQRQTTDAQRTWQRSGQQWTQNSTRYAGTWNRDWRNDRRYDWRRYRDSHRSIFHIGVYFDPFGYNYRPFNIGYRLYPNYFGQQYWIDPGMYNLPYPPPGTVWVRYWDDALLVDTYTGEVVDVIRNFFW